MKRKFAKYVSLNVFATMGVSLYLLADTYFISKANNADGITALNIVLPVYALFYAVGALIGIGSATKYSLKKAAGEKNVNRYFVNSLFWSLGVGALFSIIGFFWSEEVMSLLGADGHIVAVGRIYGRLVMTCAPFFMVHFTFSAFVRNDGDPGLAMAGTLFSSLFNIVMDYIFAFPMGMGMNGCALATVISPVLNVLICSAHFFKKDNTIRFVFMRPDGKMLLEAIPLGISSFVGELSSGVTTFVFNYLLLALDGNTAVAAYGVVANCALVATAVFNGVAQGAQPLASEAKGRGNKKDCHTILRLSVITSIVLAVLVYVPVLIFAPQIVSVFNGERNKKLAELAEKGLIIYFSGFFFGGINIVGSGYFSATDRALRAFVLALSRGLVAISGFAVILSAWLGVFGVWMAFPASELFTLLLMLTLSAVIAVKYGKQRNSSRRL